MHHAELSLFNKNKVIGYAEYRLKGKGGLALNKWASVESKMIPVIDQLLEGYTPEKVKLFKEKQITNEKPQQNKTVHKANNIEDQLRKLKAWFEEGLINKEEYEAKKTQLLSQ